MRYVNRPSWMVVVDEPDDVHLVLFVRDHFRLSGAGGPGPLVPEVPDASGQAAASIRSAAASAWPAWWHAVLDSHREPGQRPAAPAVPAPFPALAGHLDPPDFASLSATPELRELARTAFRPFLRWWAPPPGAAPARRRPGGPLGLPGARGRLIDLHLPRHTVQDAVVSLETELQRSARPFEFRIDIVAVTEPVVLLQDSNAAVISAELARDETRYRDWLHTVLRPLA